jgi:hypothetical protein
VLFRVGCADPNANKGEYPVSDLNLIKILLVAQADCPPGVRLKGGLRTEIMTLGDLSQVPEQVVGIQVIHDNGVDRTALVWTVVPGEQADSAMEKVKGIIARQVAGKIQHDRSRGMPISGSATMIRGYVYGTEPPEITDQIKPSRLQGITPLPPRVGADSISDVEAVLNPRKDIGRKLNVAESKAIEMRAVDVTREYFHNLGYRTEDVGQTESYDVRATKGLETIIVEVKGTTTDGSAVALTANEFRLHRESHPHNALAVVRFITLECNVNAPKASGGELVLEMPWQIDTARLTPIAFRYETGL